MESWDIYNQYRKKTGKTHLRGEKMKTGDYHLVVHLWIINDKNEFLIQKRQPWKQFPNMWDCAAAGSAVFNDSSIEAILRETKEEIGIDINPDNLDFLFSIKFLVGFDDVYLYKENINLEDLHLQYEEVADAKWVSKENLKELIKQGEFIKYSYFDLLFEMIDSKIKLKKAIVDEADDLLEIQKKVFQPIYEKYQDHDTNPVNQSKEKFLKRFTIGDYYKIIYDHKLAGSVFVYESAPGKMVLHIINILEEYQNKGLGQEVMKRLEMIYPEAESWELETILTEERNIYL